MDYDNPMGNPDEAGSDLVDPNQNSDGPFGKEIERILEVPLTIQVELGRKRMKIRELLEMTNGTVVELDARSGTPLMLYANKTLVAQGEAIVVGDHYGIRVTEIVSPAERVRRLGGKEWG